MTELRIASINDALQTTMPTGRRRLARAILALRTAEKLERARLPELTGQAHVCSHELIKRIGAAVDILQGMQRDEDAS